MKRNGHPFFLGGLILAIAVFAGCESSPPSAVTEVAKNEYTYDMKVIVTRGNRSFIPLNIYGDPAGNLDKIFGVIAAFESDNSGREIVFWNIEKQQKAEGANSYIWGIWVEHREKEK
ncbi:MAG: hypothetical protein HYW88_02580 [Candidatus Sungbacteria bacterium]|nr:hypothetical protein [Candidatus Sungbacteria bacterium]